MPLLIIVSEGPAWKGKISWENDKNVKKQKAKNCKDLSFSLGPGMVGQGFPLGGTGVLAWLYRNQALDSGQKTAGCWGQRIKQTLKVTRNVILPFEMDKICNEMHFKSFGL